MGKRTRALLAAMFIFCFVFLAVASTDDDAPSRETGSNSATSSAAKKDEVFKIGETAVFKDLKVTATEVKTSKGTNQFAMPKEGNIFVGVKFQIENISDEVQNLSTWLLFTAYADDVKLETQIIVDDSFEGTLDGELAPGKKMIGYYTMEVAKSVKKIDLDFSSTWLSGSKATFRVDMPAS